VGFFFISNYAKLRWFQELVVFELLAILTCPFSFIYCKWITNQHWNEKHSIIFLVKCYGVNHDTQFEKPGYWVNPSGQLSFNHLYFFMNPVPVLDKPGSKLTRQTRPGFNSMIDYVPFRWQLFMKTILDYLYWWILFNLDFLCRHNLKKRPTRKERPSWLKALRFVVNFILDWL